MDDDGGRAMAGPGLSRWAVPTAIAVVVVAGLVLRFWTRSDLWLDEALTVNVARLPLRRLSAGLRHDGAPPLYYLLLHAWMRVFGTGDVAVRSLSALFGIAALPVAWVAGRDLAGRRAGWIALVLLASSPYAIRYSTETRMYTLVMLLVLLGWVAVWRSLERPTPARLGAVALVSGMLLLTHYWSLYLLAVLEAALVWRWRREPKASNAGRVALAVVGGGVLLLPWLPDMVFQLRHTGTPWAQPATFRALVNAVSEFGGGIQDEGRGLGVLFFGLGALGLFGRALDAHRVELDLRTRPPGGGLALVAAGTLALAIAIGLATGSAYAGRYASVVFPLALLLVVLGLSTLVDRRAQVVVVALVVALGLGGGVRNVVTNRTQAGQVASVLRSRAVAGDVVGYCPDQLGPAVSRLLRDRYVQLTFPRARPPARVDWVDYADAMRAGDPVAFARLLVDRAGPGRVVWLVWSPGYRTLDARCEGIAGALTDLRGGGSEAVKLDAGTYFEHADLLRFAPRLAPR